MKKSLFLKIFSGYLIIVIVMAMLLIFFTFNSTKRYYIKTLSDNLEKIAISLIYEIKPFMIEGNYDEMDLVVKKSGKKINTRITIIDMNGIVLADSEENPDDMGNHGTRPEILKAYYGKMGSSLRFSETLEEEMLYVAVPIYREENNMIGVIRVSLFLSDIRMLLNDVRFNILVVTIVLIILSSFIAFLFMRHVLYPVRELVRVSGEIASGNFNVKLYPGGKGELRRLEESFERMVVRINELLGELSQQKEALNAIISSIKEGLLVIDNEGRILLSNESFDEITHNPSIMGKHYWEIIREPQLGEVIKQVGKNNENLIKEIQIKDRNFICSTTYLGEYEEIVLTLHDITEIRTIDKMKRDFVVNVSHELRTPLTAIKGFMETLDEECNEKEKRYVKIVLNHTDRLINIVKDLLTLSELEEKKMELEYENVNLEELIQDILNIYKDSVEKKNLSILLDIDKEIGVIKADPYRLEQMFINLLENSIKYTEEGEIKISINKDNRKVVIKIKDSGIGIPEEYVPRIFERFYVVDKSHSRKLGGTGLGLSIVKHIVLLHNGEISVESTPGSGTEFTIKLPINN